MYSVYIKLWKRMALWNYIIYKIMEYIKLWNIYYIYTNIY